VRKRLLPPSKATSTTALAAAFLGSLDAAGFPPSAAWRNVKPVVFDADWQAKSADPHRHTEVRLLWTTEFLYLKFVARYRLITVFDDADFNGRRDKLWDRDVAEVFLQPDPAELRRGIGYAVGFKNVGYSEGFNDYSTARVKLSVWYPRPTR